MKINSATQNSISADFEIFCVSDQYEFLLRQYLDCISVILFRHRPRVDEILRDEFLYLLFE